MIVRRRTIVGSHPHRRPLPMGREAIERALAVLRLYPSARDVLAVCGRCEPDDDDDERYVSSAPSDGADWLPDQLGLATRDELMFMLSTEVRP